MINLMRTMALITTLGGVTAVASADTMNDPYNKPESQSQSQSQPQTQSQPQPQTQPQTQSQTEMNKQPVQSQPQPQTQSQTQSQTEMNKQPVQSQPKAQTQPKTQPHKQMQSKTQAQTGAMKGPPEERTMGQVFFNFDSSTVKEDILPVANQLECSPNDTIILDAYTDPVGTDAYNKGLAERRALAVKDKLTAVGVSGDRIMLGIFGKHGQRRDTHAEDRRVEIRISNEPVSQLESRRQGNAVAIVAPGETPPQVGRR